MSGKANEIAHVARQQTDPLALSRIFQGEMVLGQEKTRLLPSVTNIIRHSEMTTFLRQLWGFVRPYRGRFFLGLLCGICYGLVNGLLIGAVKVVVQLVFEGETNLHQQLESAPRWIHPLSHPLASLVPELRAPAPNDTVRWLLIIGVIPAIMLLRNTLQYLSIYLTNWSAMHAIADIRTKLFSHLQNLSLGFFNRASTGDLIARITNDTQVLYSIIGSSFASVVKDPITIACLLGYQLATQPTLTLISVVVFPVCIVPIVIFGRKVRKSARAVQEYNAELTNLMHESFTGSRVIKAYNLEETVSAEFRATTKKYVGQLMRVIRANEIPSQLMEFFGAAGIALVFLYIQHSMQFLPKDQQPKSSDFLTFVLTVVMIYPPIKSLTRLHNQLHQARAASERVFQLLALKNSVPEPAAPKMLQADQADIVFENLDFNYGEKPVLRNINLTVKAGQLVALVGASGSGKTTLANLLLRFYDPVHGVVKIGGVDLRDVSTRDLRNQIAVVAQENILFNDTIRRNIELGRLGATNEEIVAAAKHAYAYEFIMQKPEGFDAVIGEKGVSLSGGQRQRLAIARAVLKNAPILVLDEALSALDSESERIVQNALDELMKGRTTICIAHRLSTIFHSDVIVVLDQGRIVETGTHAELLQRGGVYQKLYELQFAS
jgi:subfamily B ATP-binding cassette protein MsbA